MDQIFFMAFHFLSQMFLCRPRGEAQTDGLPQACRFLPYFKAFA
jgi:hypothetical protein